MLLIKSVEYEKEFFKRKEDKLNLYLTVKKNYIEYIRSPYDDHMTYKINIIKRLILYKKFLLNILKDIVLPEIIKIIIPYIGPEMKDVCDIENRSIYKFD